MDVAGGGPTGSGMTSFRFLFFLALFFFLLMSVSILASSRNDDRGAGSGLHATDGGSGFGTILGSSMTGSGGGGGGTSGRTLLTCSTWFGT